MKRSLKYYLFILFCIPLSILASTVGAPITAELQQQLTTALENYSESSPESLARISSLISQGATLPKGDAVIDIFPSLPLLNKGYYTKLYSGAGQHNFLKGFAIYRTMEDPAQPNPLLKTRDANFGNLPDKSSFENQGKAQLLNLDLEKSPNDAFSQVLLLDKDRILAAGVGDEYKLVLAAFTLDGQQIPTFGAHQGFSMIPLGDGKPAHWGTRYINAQGIIKQPVGTILVYGRYSDATGNHLFIVRFSSQGLLIGQPVIVKSAKLR